MVLRFSVLGTRTITMLLLYLLYGIMCICIKHFIILRALTWKNQCQLCGVAWGVSWQIKRGWWGPVVGFPWLESVLWIILRSRQDGHLTHVQYILQLFPVFFGEWLWIRSPVQRKPSERESLNASIMRHTVEDGFCSEHSLGSLCCLCRGNNSYVVSWDFGLMKSFCIISYNIFVL